MFILDPTFNILNNLKKRDNIPHSTVSVVCPYFLFLIIIIIYKCNYSWQITEYN